MKALHAGRLLRLADHLDTVPDVKFDYTDFIRPCGTIGCALGHAAMVPEFNALGLAIQKTDRWTRYHLTYNDRPVGTSEAISDIFGYECESALFYPGDGEDDFTAKQVASKFRTFVQSQVIEP